MQGSDHCQLLAIYNAWERVGSFGSRREFCRDNFLSDSALLTIATLRQQLWPCLCELGFIVRGKPVIDAVAKLSSAQSTLLIKAVMVAGLYPCCVRLKLPKTRFHETATGAVEVVHKDKHKIEYLLASGERVNCAYEIPCAA